MSITLQATSQHTAKRLDQYLKDTLPQHSRALLQQWIKQGNVLVNGVAVKPSYELRGAESITVQPVERPPLQATAEDLPLEVLYRDDALIAINKPSGMVVHAGAGVHSGTVVNALLHHFQQLSTTGGDLRPGIVHRLDKETSGVLLVARNDAAHQELARQFADREIDKTYLALVEGVVKADSGTITKPIARDPEKRIKMTTRLNRGRSAHTTYTVLRRFEKSTYLEVKIGTGRTHQIRVHLASLRHPVVGDRLYGAAAQPELGRFFLHAARIRFLSPATHKPVTIEAPLPPELERWLKATL